MVSMMGRMKQNKVLIVIIVFLEKVKIKINATITVKFWEAQDVIQFLEKIRYQFFGLKRKTQK